MRQSRIDHPWVVLQVVDEFQAQGFRLTLRQLRPRRVSEEGTA